MDIDPDRLEALFAHAVSLPSPAERAAALDRACAGDAALRQRLDALLRAHDAAGGSFLQRPYAEMVATVDSVGSCEGPGAVIGPYKLLEPIGEGGFGVVYLAEQTQPVRRKVALKVIKPGMDTRQVVARFEAERQALAIMDHPNIARVFDGGVTPSGPPFFVMELVKGVPLTDFCDQNCLTPRQRLELFVSVCQAVQHAHQKGIIHRDLKPSNILVTVHDNTPVPKVIDFGIAKALGQELTDKTLHTGFAQMIGTPLYMSPEQAGQSGQDIDTRSDIYSLGVLLYELLTGTTPFDRERFSQAGYDEIRRIIREEEPPRPSTRLSESQETLAISARRNTEPARLTRLVRGELDWIVMKALEKDRNRRYDSANAFAMDVQRYLNDEPVLACPPSAAYRLHKFASRNKTGLAVAGLVLVFLVLLGGGAGWVVRDQAVRRLAVTQEVHRALDESEDWYRHDRLVEAMTAVKRAEGLLAGGGHQELRQRVLRCRINLEMVARLEEIRLARANTGAHQANPEGTYVFRFDCMESDAAYRSAFREYGLDVEGMDPDEAARHIASSVVRDRLLAGLDDWGFVKWRGNLPGSSQLVAVAGRADPDPWRKEFREAFQRQDRKTLETLARDEKVMAQPAATILLVGVVLSRMDQHSLAADVLRQAQRQRPGDFWINYQLAYTLLQLDPPASAEAVGFARAALALRPESTAAHHGLGVAFLRHDRPLEAEVAFREALRRSPDDPLAHNEVGAALTEQNKLREAEATYREALRLKPDLDVVHYNLGLTLLKGDKPRLAEAAFREALRLKPGPELTRMTQYNLGLVLLGQDKFAEAEASCREAIRLKHDFAKAHNTLGVILMRKGQLPEAEAACRESIRFEPGNARVHHNLGLVRQQRGKLADAEAALREATRLKPDYAEAHATLGTTLRQLGKLADAEAAYREAIRLKPNYAQARVLCALLLHGQGKWAEAAAEFREAIRLHPDLAGAAHPVRYYRDLILEEAACREAVRLKPEDAKARLNLAAFLLRRGKLDEAEAECRQAIRLRADFAGAHYNLGAILYLRGKGPEAEAAFQEALRLDPKEGAHYSGLAWLLATGPDAKSRAPQRALEAARKGVELAPQSGEAWRALGWAQYRAGDWKATVESLEKAILLQEPPTAGDPGVWFFLAMSHWQLGNKDEARRQYDRAVQWMKKHPGTQAELPRMWAEAAELLKSDDRPKPKPESK